MTFTVRRRILSDSLRIARIEMWVSLGCVPMYAYVFCYLCARGTQEKISQHRVEFSS
jgi:hypothetical protein